MAGINAYTVLMLHCDGTNGSSSFPDDSPSNHTTSVVGVTVDTSQYKFGTGSATFTFSSCRLQDYSGSDPNYGTDFNYGSGDFTIDGWFRTHIDYAANHCLYSNINSGSDVNHIRLRINSSNKLVLYATSNDSSWDIANGVAGSHDISFQTWQHFAIVRNGTSLKVYLDGVEDISVTTSASITNPIAGIMFGRDIYNSLWLNGNLDELRIQNGEAYWTTDFTPETEAYSEESHGSGDIIIPAPTSIGYEDYYSVGSGNIFIHAPTMSGSESTLDTTGMGVVLVPALIIEAISEWTTGSGNILVPTPEINGESYGTSGVGEILVPAPVVDGESFSTVGWGVITIPVPDISVSGGDGTNGSGEIKVPAPIIIGYELVGDTTGSGVILVPAPIIQGSELYDALVCLVMGLDAGMPLSEYTNYDFVGFARLGSMYLALSKDGNIYRLGGDTDITESVDSVIETGQDDLGVSTSKRLMGLVAGLRSDGLMQYRAHRWNEYGEYIEIETTESDVVETRKLQSEKVPLSRTIGLEFSNVDGADFSIDSIEMDIRLSPRRSGGS